MPKDEHMDTPHDDEVQSIGEDLSAVLDSELVEDEYLWRAFGLPRGARAEFAERYGRLPVGERPALSPFFDAAWYLAQYEDVRRTGADPLLHFIRYGIFELRSPHPMISIERIYDDNRELFYREGGCQSLLRVLRENLSSPSEHFDVEFYLEHYPQAREHAGGALHHFLEHGKREGLKPNGHFRPDGCAEQYSHSPTGSLLLRKFELACSCNAVDLASYCAATSTVFPTPADAFAHYQQA